MGAGFFGKLPTAGDFVARGIPAGLRGPLDHWLTSGIVPIVRDAKAWPEGGVRAVAMLNDAPWLLVIEPSADSVGRVYPLTACCLLGGAALAEANVWAGAAWSALLQATEKNASVDSLRDLLARVSLPVEGLDPLVPAVMWWDGTAPDLVEVQLARLVQISSG